MGRERSHDVVFEAQAVSAGRMRNDITVHWPQMGESWQLATDEPPGLGGDSSAPPPHAYIVAGLAGCLMTNIRMMAAHFEVPIEELRVAARAEWERRVTPGAPHRAATRGFLLDIEIDSDAEDATVLRLVEAARDGCFVEDSLTEAVQVSHRLKLGYGWQEL